MLTRHPHSNLRVIIWPGLLRPHLFITAVVAVATGALACKDTTTPKQFSTAGIAEPRFTAGVGFGGATVGRGNVGTLNIKCTADRNDDQGESRGNRDDKSKAAGYCVQVKSKDNSDILVTNLAIAPSGHSGWHYHPGPVLVVVKTGAATLYHANDPTCTGARYPAGTVFIEQGGHVHIARNEGSVELTMVATSFLPAGGPGRIDASAPGNCPF
jgi:quercetin dioxygenase-like cupin family protein